MKLKKYILAVIAVIFLAGTNSFAAPEGNFHKLLKEYTFHPDGIIEFHYNKELTINSHLALNNLYGETFIIYNPEYQELKFNTAYTKQADGQIINMPQNAFNEVLPSEAADAPAYNGMKEMVVTHTGLELGATIYLDYTIFTKPGYYKNLDIDELLQEDSPVKDYTLIINIPENETLNYTLSNSNSKPSISEKARMKQYRWTIKNIPAANREPFQPENHDNSIRLTANQYPSQQEALENLRQILDKPLNDEGRNFTQNLIKDEKTEREKILAIQQYVLTQVANTGLTLENTGYQTRTPSQVFRSSYGTAAEKTSLLAAMLRAAGFQPEFVAVFPAGTKNTSRGLASIKALSVMVNANQIPLFLSATRQPSISPELRGNRDEIWLISEKNIRPLTVINGEAIINTSSKIRLNPSQAQTEASIRIKGGIIPTSPQKATESAIKSYSSPFGQAQSVEVKLALPQEALLTFQANQKLESGNGHLIYKLPSTNKGINSWWMSTLNTERTSMTELPYALKEQNEYEITLEPGMELKTPPVQIRKEFPVGKVNISFMQEGDKLKVNREIEISKTLLTPTEYKDFRTLLNIWTNPNTETLVIGIR